MNKNTISCVFINAEIPYLVVLLPPYYMLAKKKSNKKRNIFPQFLTKIYVGYI